MMKFAREGCDMLGKQAEKISVCNGSEVFAGLHCELRDSNGFDALTPSEKLGRQPVLESGGTSKLHHRCVLVLPHVGN